ncbi:MAG: ADP-forming succinate--CoA ligase subunit beta [Candidatus Zixiibacteriota bacterium]|nr:MAG: ADP-forming succinate--CoA ligase subunit beta [candidate division Zixibacteria bacterium]
MKIHEYQAKEIFASFGIPVPKGKIAFSADEARNLAVEIGKPVMVKAQVHVGGRGKAGGIKYCATPDEAYSNAEKIVGMNIKGLIVRKVLVTEATDISHEAYVGIIVDRSAKKPVIMVSAEGGIDIEEVAAKTPEKIHKLHVDPILGMKSYQARQLAYKIYSNPETAKQAAGIILKLYRCFMEADASLVEINPLVTTPAGDVVALDAKINLDDNGLYRHPDYEKLRDVAPQEESENEAREAGLSFVGLSGNIGCVVNGAGLAMATMDLVKHYGGEPANFLDIGGSSNPEKVVTAMRIILRDPNVKAILFNIFGGITRCDDVANGIAKAVSEFRPSVPIVVRLTGTNEAEGREILAQAQIQGAETMVDVVTKAIALAGVA